MEKKMDVEWYEHHGNVVAVRRTLRGRHWDHCLCSGCAKFRPDTPENCEIAQSTYENCVKYGITTPMWECPQFERTETRK